MSGQHHDDDLANSVVACVEKAQYAAARVALNNASTSASYARQVNAVIDVVEAYERNDWLGTLRLIPGASEQHVKKAYRYAKWAWTARKNSLSKIFGLQVIICSASCN